jgi:hypothetical protein
MSHLQQRVNVVNVDLPKLEYMNGRRVQVGDGRRGASNDEREAVLVSKHLVKGGMDEGLVGGKIGRVFLVIFGRVFEQLLACSKL